MAAAPRRGFQTAFITTRRASWIPACPVLAGHPHRRTHVKRSRNIRTIRIAALAALAIPVAALAQEPPEPAPVDPATPVDTAPPVDATPPRDPMEATDPWTPPTADPTTQPPPATPPAQSGDTTSHVLHDEDGREVRLTEHPPNSVVGD